MKTEGKNDAMFKRMFKNAYDTTCQTAYEEFGKLARGSDIKSHGNIIVEIEALAYFSFDFEMSLGPETAIRNALRDLFAESVAQTNNNAELFSNRAMEYIAELQRNVPEKNKLLNLGNVFAKHTNNGEDIMVVTWAIEQIASIRELVNQIMEKILQGLPRKQ